MQGLPIVVDLPSDEPRFGFDKYTEGIVAAIMGGEPPQFTIGLYGPWGTGKSSLLAAIAKRLDSCVIDDHEKPIVVRFDAWRYGDKGSVLLAILWRISQTVDELLKANRDRSKRTKDQLFTLLTAVNGLANRVEVSAFGVSLSLFGDKPDEGKTKRFLMPFEELGDVVSSLGGKRRIVILLDDLDRCTPETVLEVIEAIRIITDIKGIVFVLALDYEYLTNSIASKYPGVDADRFIEKIVQVPFHLPANQIENSAIEDVIQNWEMVKPLMSDVDERDFKAVMRVALRSNPRQIKRLVNTYMLAKHMEGESKDFDESLVLKVLALQISWPTVYSDIQQELSRKFSGSKTFENESGFSDRLGSLSSFARWLDDDINEDELAELAINDVTNSYRTDEKKRLVSALKYEKGLPIAVARVSEESRVRLEEFLDTVLDQETSASKTWAIMCMAVSGTAIVAERPEVKPGTIGKFEFSLDRADEKLRTKYDDVKAFIKSLDHVDFEETNGLMVSALVDDRKVPFSLITLRPTQQTLRLEVALYGTDLVQMRAEGFSLQFRGTLKQHEGYLLAEHLEKSDDVEISPALRKIIEFAAICARGADAEVLAFSKLRG